MTEAKLVKVKVDAVPGTPDRYVAAEVGQLVYHFARHQTCRVCEVSHRRGGRLLVCSLHNSAWREWVPADGVVALVGPDGR